MSRHSTPQKRNRTAKPAEQGGFLGFIVRHRPSKGAAVALTGITVVLGLLFVWIGSLLLQFSYNYNAELENKPDDELGISGDAADKPTDIINIALFGLGSRTKTSFKGVSDSIMVLSIDKLHNKIKVISFARDSLVNIEGYSPYKINSAYSKGGALLAIKTLNQNVGRNSRDYATVNFTGMADIIDAVGGVEIAMTNRERKDANIHIRSAAKEVGTDPTQIEYEEDGVYHLNGAQAVAFARIRHVSTADGVSNDFGRTDRQRYVLEQLFNTMLTRSVDEYPAMIRTILQYVETSLNYSKILDMAGILPGGVKFVQARVPMDDYLISGSYYVRGGACVYYNLKYAGDLVNAFIYDDIPAEEFIERYGVDTTGWYSGGSYTNRTQAPSSTATESTTTTTPGNIFNPTYDFGTTESTESTDSTDSTDITDPTGSTDSFDPTGSTDVGGTTASGDPTGSTAPSGSTSTAPSGSSSAQTSDTTVPTQATTASTMPTFGPPIPQNQQDGQGGHTRAAFQQR